MKKKISVSLDEELLKSIDFMIDGKEIQNRSYAIEHLVRDSLQKMGASKAVVLAGGKTIGDKPFSIVQDDVGQRELLVSALMKLKANGVRDVIFACDKGMRSKIEVLIGSLDNLGINVGYSVEKEPVGSAGAVALLKDRLNEDFFVISGDVFFDFDLEKMLAYHKRGNNLATVAVTATSLSASKDSIAVEGDRIVSFDYEYRGVRTYLVNAGVYVFSPRIFDYLPSRGSLESMVFPRLASENRLNCYLFVGRWEHMD